MAMGFNMFQPNPKEVTHRLGFNGFFTYKYSDLTIQHGYAMGILNVYLSIYLSIYIYIYVYSWLVFLVLIY